MAVNNLNTPGVGIQPSLIDAKGDLIAGTAADAVGRLAVGTNGQQLVADSTASTGLKWDNPSGLVHIDTVTFSSVSAVNVNDVFSATYYNYLVSIILTGGPSANATFSCRMRNSGTDDSTSNYNNAIPAILTNNTATNITGATQTSFNFGGANSGGWASYNYDAIVRGPFSGAATGWNTRISAQNATGFFGGAGSQVHNVFSSFDGFSFISTQSLSGVVRVYGLVNS
jgi:hypothetical protein